MFCLKKKQDGFCSIGAGFGGGTFGFLIGLIVDAGMMIAQNGGSAYANGSMIPLGIVLEIVFFLPIVVVSIALIVFVINHFKKAKKKKDKIEHV